MPLKFFSNPFSLIYAIELLKYKSKTHITHKDSNCNLLHATCKAQTQDHSVRIPAFHSTIFHSLYSLRVLVFHRAGDRNLA